MSTTARSLKSDHFMDNPPISFGLPPPSLVADVQPRAAVCTCGAPRPVASAASRAGTPSSLASAPSRPGATVTRQPPHLAAEPCLQGAQQQQPDTEPGGQAQQYDEVARPRPDVDRAAEVPAEQLPWRLHQLLEVCAPHSIFRLDPARAPELVIEVDERDVETGSEACAELRLPGAGVANDDYAPVARRFSSGTHPPRRFERVSDACRAPPRRATKPTQTQFTVNRVA